MEIASSRKGGGGKGGAVGDGNDGGERGTVNLVKEGGDVTSISQTIKVRSSGIV
jgi:hypothetical protein